MEEGGREELGFERVVFFSDAVFAIAITLLVLELRVPHLEPGAGGRALLLALVQLVPKLVGFVVSFVVVGKMWMEHHRIFRYIGGYDDGLLWRNLFLLLAVAFMPFPTAVYSEKHEIGAALAFYAGSLGLVGLAKVEVWRYAARGRRLLIAGVSAATVRRISRRSWAVPLTCALIALLGLLHVPGAYVAFGLIPLVAWLLGRSLPAEG